MSKTTISEKDKNIGKAHPYLEELEKALAGGLQFTNLIASLNQDETKENTLLLHSLVEVLVSKGVVHVHELEQRRNMLRESMQEGEDQKPKVYLTDAPDKYTQADESLYDCADNYPYCKGRCCTLWFALSAQDLHEGIVKWDYLHPYGIAQDEEGYCVHFNRDEYTCGVYENRPLICRTFDCRQDKRLWVDYEQKVFNPEFVERVEGKTK